MDYGVIAWIIQTCACVVLIFTFKIQAEWIEHQRSKGKQITRFLGLTYTHAWWISFFLMLLFIISLMEALAGIYKNAFMFFETSTFHALIFGITAIIALINAVNLWILAYHNTVEVSKTQFLKDTFRQLETYQLFGLGLIFWGIGALYPLIALNIPNALIPDIAYILFFITVAVTISAVIFVGRNCYLVYQAKNKVVTDLPLAVVNLVHSIFTVMLLVAFTLLCYHLSVSFVG